VAVLHAASVIGCLGRAAGAAAGQWAVEGRGRATGAGAGAGAVQCTRKDRVTGSRS